MEATQEKLDLQVEHFSEREKFLIARLREFYTIDREIRETEKHARGEDLPYEPSITASAPKDDDPIVMRILQQDVLPESAKQIVSSIQAYVSPDEFSYAATYRVTRKLEHIEPVTKEHEEHIEMVLKLLRERYGDPEEYLQLTDTERIAVKREAYIADARERLPILQARKRIIGQALDDLKRYYPEWYIILYNRYVLNKHWREVCRMAAREGVPLTDEEYRLARKKALHQFDRWAVGLC